MRYFLCFCFLIGFLLQAYASAPGAAPLPTGNVISALSPKPAPTPSPAPSPTAWIKEGVNLTFNENFRGIDNCVGVNLVSSKLPEKAAQAVLANKYYREQGEAFCLFMQHTCKNKCIPLLVNGRTK